MARSVLVVLALGLFLPFCFGQDEVDLGEIVVTPLRTESLSKHQQAHTVVISHHQIEDKNLSTLAEGLQFIEGVEVVGGGRLGSASQSVNIRGAQSRHTAYLFEGIKVYDPSNPSSYYVPADFLAAGWGKLEVVKFPLSSLYGSSPLGGAISFRLKKPPPKPYISLTSLLGSYGTCQETLELGGQAAGIAYLFNASRLDSKGISRARAKNNNPENDPYQNTTFTLSFKYQQPQDWEGGLSLRSLHTRNELDDDDNLDGFPEDDPDNLSWNNELLGTVYFKKDITPFLAYKIQGGFTSLYRKYFDDNVGGGDEYTRSWYRGQTYQFSNHLKLKPFDFYELLLGFDYTREKMDGYRYTYDFSWMFGYESDSAKQVSHSRGWFLEQIITPTDNLEIDFSYRREKHPRFKYHDVLKGALSYSPQEFLTLYFSYGEGFKDPSLYQLYSSNGNTALRPEQSKSWELGTRLNWGDELSFLATYFHSNFRDLIDFVYTNPSFWIGQYKNAAKAKSRGVELKLEAQPLESLSLGAGYTYLNGDEDFVDQDFVTIFKHSRIRVPANKVFLKIGWQEEKFRADLDLSYTGHRYDRIWVGMTDQFVLMKSYILGNLNLSYQLNDDFQVFAKVNNIFNKDYERIKGYQEEKACFYGGLKCQF